MGMKEDTRKNRGEERIRSESTRGNRREENETRIEEDPDRHQTEETERGEDGRKGERDENEDSGIKNRVNFMLILHKQTEKIAANSRLRM